MAFDPDAYLAGGQSPQPAPSSGFDPDAYLAGGSAPAQPATPAPRESKLKLPEKAPIPSNWRVAMNAVPKGVAAVGDMVGNVIPNAVNLGTAIVGTGLHKAGLIDSPPDLPVENPDMFRKTGEAIGVINPEYNPQTPGQRYLDTGVQAATGALLTGGAGGVRQALANVAGGVTGGEVAQLGAETGHPILGLLAGIGAGGATAASVNRLTGATTNAALQQQNAIRDANFLAAREAGLKIPVSQSNPDSLIANTLDIVAGGRPRMQQAAAIMNRSRATQAAARDLGIDASSPISETTIRNVIGDAYRRGYDPLQNAGIVRVSPRFNSALDELQSEAIAARRGFPGYDDGGLVRTIDSLRTNEFDSSSGVAMIRQLRADANRAYASGDSQLGRALRGASNAIEDEMELHLESTGQQQLLTNYRNARQQIARASTVERALNAATGDVSAQKLGRALDRGVPLSGEMRLIAEASKLPGASLADTKYSTTGASQLEGLASIGGALGTGNPLLLAAPIARGALRRVALSDVVGRALGTPTYNRARLTGDNANALMINAGLAAERQAEK